MTKQEQLLACAALVINGVVQLAERIPDSGMFAITASACVVLLGVYLGAKALRA